MQKLAVEVVEIVLSEQIFGRVGKASEYLLSAVHLQLLAKHDVDKAGYDFTVVVLQSRNVQND